MQSSHIANNIKRELCTCFTKRKNRVQNIKKSAFSRQKIAKNTNIACFYQFLMLMNLSILVVQSSQSFKALERNLVVFDFDGTLTRRDSLLAFIKFSRGLRRFSLGFLWLSPRLLRYYLKLTSNHDLKQRILSYFFKGLKRERLEEMGDAFFQSTKDFFINKKIEGKLLAYKAKGDAVVIVSASCAEWVKPFADYWQVRFIGTELQYEAEKFTGKIQGQNCFGKEKLRRLSKGYAFERFHKKIAFGDQALADWADVFTRVG